MVEKNSDVEAVIPSPEQSFFRLEYLLPPDQMQNRLSMVITIHHRRNRSYGNAWLVDPSKKTMQFMREIVFPEPPKESHLFAVLGALSAAINSQGIRLGPVGDLYLSCFNWKIQDLLEKRADGIFSSTKLNPLEKARKIYGLIISEGMEAKYIWTERIHELAFEGGAVSLLDAGLCEARLFHEQSKSTLGRRYM